MARFSAVAVVAALVFGSAVASAPASSSSRGGRAVACWTATHHPGARTADATPHPSQAECNRAKKILTQWERLAQKLGIKISKKRRDDLRRKTQNGTIKIADLPGGLRRHFPSELDRFDLNQIINICNGLPPGQGSTITV